MWEFHDVGEVKWVKMKVKLNHQWLFKRQECPKAEQAWLCVSATAKINFFSR